MLLWSSMNHLERYFAMKNKNARFVSSYKILKLTNKKVEILNGPDSDLEYFEFSQDRETKKYNINTNYNLNEVSRRGAEKIIKKQEKYLLGEHMISSENKPSDNLTKNSEKPY